MDYTLPIALITCSIFKSQDLVHIFTLCSQHNHRHIRKLPDLLAYLKSIQFRKHHIQQNQIILTLLCVLQCLFPVICTIYFHTFLFQAETDSFHDQFFIIYN